MGKSKTVDAEVTEQIAALEAVADNPIYADGVHGFITPDSKTLLEGALVVVTGPKGSGKSLFATTALMPDDIGRAYIDDSEFSQNRTMQEIVRLQDAGIIKDKFGRYNDLESMFADKLPKSDSLIDRLNTGQLPWVDG